MSDRDDVFELEGEAAVVELIDENGEAAVFDHLATIEYGDDSYAVMVPLDNPDSEEGDIIIMRIVHQEDDDVYEGIDDSDLIDAVFERFTMLAGLDDEDDGDE